MVVLQFSWNVAWWNMFQTKHVRVTLLLSLRLGASRVYFIKQSVLLALRVFLVLCVGTCFAAEQCYLSTLAHAAQ